MKKIVKACILLLLMIPTVMAFSQSRLGVSYLKIDEEFVVDSVTCFDKQFEKNVEYGYHLFTKMSYGTVCFYLDENLICYECLYKPYNDAVLQAAVEWYNSLENASREGNTWKVKNTEDGSMFKIEMLDDMHDKKTNVQIKYFRFSYLKN